MHIQKIAALSIAVFGAGCASASHGTKPADMSAAAHTAAGADEQAQASHEHKEAMTQSLECPDPYYAKGEHGEICWTSTVNAAASHEEEATRHRDLAAAHRTASASLIAAEQHSCGGISEEDRDLSPFRHKEDILSVSELDRTDFGTAPTLTGAEIVFRAVRGLTAQYLERIIDCHLARSAELGSDAQAMPFCPLMVHGASASVRAVRDGFAIDIRSPDEKGGREILARAERVSGQKAH